MKAALLLALLPAVCLCSPANPSHAQQQSSAATGPSQADPEKTASLPCARKDAATGRIAGVLKDQSGALVPDVKIEALHLVSGVKHSLVTDRQGRFVFDGLPVGLYQVTAVTTGFQIAVIHDVSVPPCAETTLNITLKIAPARAVVEVNAPETAFTAVPHTVDESDRARSRNTAELLRNTPGVSLRENGQLASIPLLHGLGDERAKLVVDGMTVSSSCPNHMNPPLTYASPARAAQVAVMPGITPVSMGGDSIGGTVAIEYQPPVFANANEAWRAEVASSGFYRSNGENYGGSFSEWVGGRNLAIGYTGSWANNDNYTDGSGHKVTSTYAQTTDHTVTLAATAARNLVVPER